MADSLSSTYFDNSGIPKAPPPTPMEPGVALHVSGGTFKWDTQPKPKMAVAPKDAPAPQKNMGSSIKDILKRKREDEKSPLMNGALSSSSGKASGAAAKDVKSAKAGRAGADSDSDEEQEQEGKEILKGIELTVYKGQLVVIVGQVRLWLRSICM